MRYLVYAKNVQKLKVSIFNWNSIFSFSAHWFSMRKSIKNRC